MPRLAGPAYDAGMVRSLSCLALLALAACAGGEELSQSSGFGGSWPAPTTPGTSATTAGMSSTSEPTSGSTTDLIRPDMGVEDTSTGEPDVTTGVDPSGVASSTTEPATTGPQITCGDGIIEAPEECEGANLNGQTCAGLGFTGGTLVCAANCVFDKTQCVSESCGDGTLNGGEECDCGQVGSPCTGPQLGEAVCAGLVAPANGNYHGGTLACGSPQSCVFNKAGCIWCGDGVRNGPEACEGGDLGGQTCNGLGFSAGGTLSCNADCTHNTGGCVNAICGDGQCNAGEDSCSCPGDCPDDPGSCSACECGLQGGPNCFCDAACIQYGDCCAGGPC